MRSNEINLADSLNYIDDNGLKQGKWIYQNEQGAETCENYINDTLNGYWSVTHGCWREVKYYYKGLKDSIHITYYDYTSDNILGFWKYEKGNYVWGTCYAANVDYLIPHKDFSVQNDSTYISVNHPNGKLWYKGLFRKENVIVDSINSREVTVPVGIHYVYFTNGKLKGIVDYDQGIIEEFDINGNQMYQTGFVDLKTHKQFINNILMKKYWH